MQAIVIYSNLSLDKNMRWRTVGGLAHSREGLGLVRPPLPSRHWESLLPCWLACIMFTKSCGMVVAGARCLSGVECGSVVVRLVRVRRQRFV